MDARGTDSYVTRQSSWFDLTVAVPVSTSGNGERKSLIRRQREDLATAARLRQTGKLELGMIILPVPGVDITRSEGLIPGSVQEEPESARSEGHRALARPFPDLDAA